MPLYSKEEYLKRIKNTPLFDIDREQNELLYKTELNKFQNLVASYYHEYFREKIEEFGLEFTTTLLSCIKAYDKRKGDFLAGFNSILKRNIGIAKAKNAVDNIRKGIKTVNNEDLEYRRLIKYAFNKNIYLTDPLTGYVNEEEILKLAKITNKDPDKIKKMLAMGDDAVTLYETIIETKDGEEVSLFERSSKCISKSAEDERFKDERIQEFFEVAEKEFLNLSNRKGYIV